MRQRLSQMRQSSAPGRGRPDEVARLGRDPLSLDTEATLQVRRATVHNTRADDRMTLELDGQSFEKGAPLHRMDRRCGGLDCGKFGIVQGERHRWLHAGGRHV